jgi:hypothetical protein
MVDVPDQMKKDNWSLYVLARSNDPTVMVPYTRKLVSNLINAMRIAEEPKYDGVLLRCLTMSNEAWAKFARDSEWGAAVQDCEGILDQIVFLMYDKRWSISQPDSFKNLLTNKGDTGGV